MRKIISHLKDNWIRHGFETLVVTVGILGAFTLNNWNENSKRNNQEIEILENLLGELNELKKETEAFIENEEYHLKVNKYFVKKSDNEVNKAGKKIIKFEVTWALVF